MQKSFRSAISDRIWPNGRTFAKVLPFGHIGPDIPPEEVLGQDMKFKNGRGAYVVLDFDYGTHRIWGDRAVAFYETEVRFQ